MTAVFVDTNILVYAVDSSEPAKRPVALATLDRLWQEGSARTSVQVLSEYYTTVTRKLPRRLSNEQAWENVEDLLNWDPLAIDGNVMRRGHDVGLRYRLTWWDSLIIAAAELQGCALLLSEDFQHGGVYGSVTVRNPFVASANEQLPHYLPATVTASKHPPRGRPRKSHATV